MEGEEGVRGVKTKKERMRERGREGKKEYEGERDMRIRKEE